MKRIIKVDIVDKTTKKVLNTFTNEQEVYEKLYDCMSAKYFFKAPWVKRIVQRCNYDGTRNVKVYCDNNTIWDFTVKA